MNPMSRSPFSSRLYFPEEPLSAFAPAGRSEQHRSPPDAPSGRASNERHERRFSVKISPVTPTPHITHIAQNRRSDTLRDRFKDRNALHMVGHREQVERPQRPHPVPPVPEVRQVPSQRRRVARHVRDLARARASTRCLTVFLPAPARGGSRTIRSTSVMPVRGRTASTLPCSMRTRSKVRRGCAGRPRPRACRTRCRGPRPCRRSGRRGRRRRGRRRSRGRGPCRPCGAAGPA